MTRYAPTFPRKIRTIPGGTIVVHNRAAHHAGQMSAEDGFRVWFDGPHDNYVKCAGGWRPDLGTHYQVRAQYNGRK
jgi:hypothetical protein